MKNALRRILVVQQAHEGWLDHQAHEDHSSCGEVDGHGYSINHIEFKYSLLLITILLCLTILNPAIEFLWMLDIFRK